MNRTVSGLVLTVLGMTIQVLPLVAQQQLWFPLSDPRLGSITSLASINPGTILAGGLGSICLSLDSGLSWQFIQLPTAESQVNAVCVLKDGSCVVGTSPSGVYRANDFWDRWTQQNEGLQSLSIRTFASDNSANLFAGTWGGGVHVSVDKGRTWLPRNAGLSSPYISGLAIDLTGYLYVGTPAGVFRSTDAGNQWSTLPLPSSNCDVRGIIATASGRILIATMGHGVYASTNQGVTWVSSNAGLATINLTTLATGPLGRVAVCSSEGVLWHSSNDGLSWNTLPVHAKGGSSQSLCIDESGRILSGRMSSIVGLSATALVWKTVYAGELRDREVYKMAIDSSGSMILATDMGLFTKNSAGTEYKPCGLADTQIVAVGISARGSLFASAVSGAYRSTNHGKDWSLSLSTLGKGYASAPLAISPEGSIFALQGYGGTDYLMVSHDDGVSWKYAGLMEPDIRVLTFDGSGILWAGNGDGNIFRSTDDGIHWTSTFVAASPILSISVNSLGMLFVRSPDRGVLRSTDNGSTWVETNNGLHDLSITSLAIDGENSVYVGVKDRGVFRSKDNGNTWFSWNTGLRAPAVSDLLFDPFGFLICGTAEGASRSVRLRMSRNMATPTVLEVRDTPNDQGGKVQVVWSAPKADYQRSLIDRYSVWRVVVDATNPGVTVLDAARQNVERSAFPRRVIDGMDGRWIFEWLGDVPAHGSRSYAATVSTLSDSTTSAANRSFFVVSAQTQEPPGFYDSNVDSGYSIDNLAPDGPLRFIVKGVNTTNSLRWARNGEPDLKCYLLYRGDSPSFLTDSIHFLATTRDTLFVDSPPQYPRIIYYAILAEDLHGNKSTPTYSAVITTAELPEPEAARPQNVSLLQNYPNPFNSTTTIRYGLPRRSYLTLAVFNTLGETVVVVQEGERDAGYHEVKFDASGLSSGVYFYRLKAGELVQIRRLALIR